MNPYTNHHSDLATGPAFMWFRHIGPVSPPIQRYQLSLGYRQGSESYEGVPKVYMDCVVDNYGNLIEVPK